jgi:hypothetical protein
MDVDASLDAAVQPDALFAWVEDLARYPAWLEIVPRAEPVEGNPADEGPAWSVDLRGQVGPFARSKRLRMVRVVHEPPTRVVFERREHDGRRHSLWRLTAEVRAASEGSVLDMHLHYGGRLGGGPVEGLLAREIEGSRQRLLDLLAGVPPPG